MATIAHETHIDRLHFLIETQRLINAGVADTDRVMSVVIDRAQAMADADGASVEMVEKTTWSALARAWLGGEHQGRARASDLESFRSMRTVGDTARCAGTPRRTPRVDSEASRRAGVRSIAVAPLVHAGQGVGVLKVVSGEPDHFSDADGEVLELMATFIVASLANAVTFERDAERALRGSSHRIAQSNGPD